MTPDQVLTVAAIGGAAGVLLVAALAALSYALGVTLCQAFERLREWRWARTERRRDLAVCRAIHHATLTAHDPKDPR
ncbi:hypothetical protein [Streptomyces soliscabiei]|uniref:hypothetical protein n=1 Tax=Streptomyces soliscabiei TaxID=588897 RepID=UPI0029B3CEC6|nr:hypothetical protein [Streptomyces sp. NY05-11A]MDX2681082.1 hypothetical protein [Streptomyces sp. NY05-11A]